MLASKGLFSPGGMAGGAWGAGVRGTLHLGPEDGTPTTASRGTGGLESLVVGGDWGAVCRPSANLTLTEVTPSHKCFPERALATWVSGWLWQLWTGYSTRTLPHSPTKPKRLSQGP